MSLNTPINVLIAEDSEDDTMLIVRELRRSGFEPTFTRIQDASTMRKELVDGKWDLIISDHNMPAFTSSDALEEVQNSHLDVPVIVVSGIMGEEFAVEAMRLGAHDYVMKGNLARLAPAIERELREAKRRKAHRVAEDTIRHMAYHDSLTDLANRHEFEARLERAIFAARTRGKQHALLYLDLDQFKIINDICGHTAGDELLKRLASLLGDMVRDSDTLARLGGDEFGVLLESCPLPRAQEIAESIRTAIENYRFVWNGRPFNIQVSIGMVPISGRDESVRELLSGADTACYAAKDLGRNRVQVYAEENIDVLRRYGEMEWVGRINQALERQQFVLYAQAIVPLANPKIPVSHEFLIRLRGDDGALILPGVFIPAAERYNLMPALDRWVIKTAFAYLSKHREAGQFFINLSGNSLSDSSFFGFIREQLRYYKLRGDSVCFEVTETAAIANFAAAIEFIKDIKNEGCKWALDDFGSGLSSFSYLKSMPVDYLKIDGTFVRNILTDQIDAAIVEAINNIGAEVGIETIAEFVESDQIKAKLKTIGVQYGQGFGIEMPKPLLVPKL